MIREGARLIIEPIKPQKKYSLDELLKDMKKENVHDEIEWGKPEGQEWW